MEVGEKNKVPSFDDTEPVEAAPVKFEDTEEVVPEGVKKKVETTGSSSTTGSQGLSGASGSAGQSTSNKVAYSFADQKPLPAPTVKTTQYGEEKAHPEITYKETLPELKKQVKNTALNNGFQTRSAIEAYGQKLKAYGYTKADVDTIKDHAEKIASTAPMYNDLKAQVNKNPDDRNAQYALGTLELNSGDPGAAISFFTKALTLPHPADPQATATNPFPQKIASSDSNALYGIGYAKQQLGDNNEAEDYYKQAIQADPTNASAIKGLASITYKKGDHAGAQELLAHANQVGAPQQKLEAQGAQYREEKAHENDRSEHLKAIADGLENLVAGLNPGQAIVGGVEHGVETIKQAPEVYAKEGAVSGALRLGVGVTQIGLGVLMATPEGMIFNVGAGAAETVLPDDVSRFLMSPVSSSLNYMDVKPSEAEKSLASFGDIIAQALIMKGIHGKNAEAKKLGEKFKNNEPITKDEWTKFTELASGITDEEIAEATKKVNESTGVKDKKLNNLEKEKLDLQAAHDTSKEGDGKQLIADQLKDVEYKIADRRSDMVTEHHQAASNEARVVDLTQRINKLKDNLKDIPEDSPKAQKVLENKIEELNKELKTLKPTEDAIQEQGAGSVLQHSQEGTGESGSERKRVEPIKQGAEVAKESEEPQSEESVRQTDEEKDVATLEKEMLSLDSEISNEYKKPVKDFDKIDALSKEFSQKEKITEKKERDSVFSVPLKDASLAIDALIKKEKEMPNGYGSFLEKRDASESKQVIEKYLDAKDISNQDLMKDFSDALRGRPTTWYADGLQLRESAKEAAKRGILFEDLIKEVKKIYTDEGYSEDDANGVVKMFLEPIFKGAEVADHGLKEEPPLPPKPPVKKITQSSSEEPEIPKETKKLKNETSKGAERIAESDNLDEAGQEIKEGIKEKGLKYIPTSREMTHENVKQYIDHFDQADKLDVAAEHLRDTHNEMTSTVRALVGAELFKRYAKKANEAQTPQQRSELSQKAVRIGQLSTERFREAGKEVEAAKVWKEMLKKTPEGAITLLKDEYAKRNDVVLKPYEKAIKSAKKFFDEVLQSDEFKKAVEKGVSEEIEKRGEALFGKEQKKKVADFFDSLKVDVKGKAFDATLGIPVAVYNGAIETIKQSVLLGANAANAIKSGIDYIKKHHLGEWEEKKFEEDLKEKFKSSGIKTKGEKASKISKGPDEKTQKTILDKWAKRLDKLNDKSRRQLLADSIEELTKEGALSDERFKELYAKAMGLSTVTPQVQTRIRSLIDTVNKGDKEAENLQKLLKENAPESDLKKAIELWQKVNQDAAYANEEIAGLFRKEKRISNTIISAMLGNMLSTTSVVFSAAYNVANSPVRLLNRGVASVGDFLLSQIAKTKIVNKILKNKAPSEQRVIDALAAWKGQLQGIGPAAKEAGVQFVKGETQKDYARYELYQKVEPIRAWKELIDGPIKYVVDELMKKPHHEKLNGYKQLNNFLEGTIGLPGTVLFRALNLTDKPFRGAAQAGALREIGVLKGLKGNELKKFMMFPDAESLEKAMTQGEHATLQQSEGVVKQIQDAISNFGNSLENTQGLLRIIASSLRIVGKSQVPFIKMPLNAVMLTAKYAIPELTSLPNAIRHAYQGNRRLALENFAEYITATSIRSVAQSLIAQGIATGNIEGDDKRKSNIRSEIYENVKPYSLNVSLFKRMMAGESAAPQKDDLWINYQKLGLLGSMLALHSSASKKTGADYSYLQDVLGRTIAVGQTTLEQSFLQNTNQLLNALAGGASDVNRWTIGTVGALGSIFWPNTLSNISNATLDEYKETKDKKLETEIKNVFKKKMFMGDDLPSKITLWGEPIKNTPADVNPLMYNMFYIHKPYQVNTESFGYKIYDEWKKTKEDALIPTFPKTTFKVNGNKVELDPQQREKYFRLVGKERAALVSYYVQSGDFDQDDLQEKKKKLKEIYNQGQKLGQELLLDIYPKLEADAEQE